MEDMATFANPSLDQSATNIHVDAAAPVSQSATNQQFQPAYEGQQRRSQQMACLYTKQKTQKKKKWHDGRLVLHSMGASLYDANPPPGSGDPKLDECCLTRPQCEALIRQTETRLETEKFLVQVEGPWTVSTASVALAKPNALVSQGMKKVITCKFRKPSQFVPKHPMQEQNQPPGMRKRQRQPLQPGELQRQYHGEAMPQQPRPPPGMPPSWNQGMHPQGQQNPMAPRIDNRSPLPPYQQQRQQPQQPFQQGGQNIASNGNKASRPQHQYSPTAVAHQTAPQQQAAQPSRHPTALVQGNNPFAVNKFNANQFYGEDEECSQGEEEESDDNGWNIQPEVPWNANPQQSSAAPNQTHANSVKPSTSAASSSTNTSDPATFPPRQATTPTGQSGVENTSSGNSAALSTNELLKLFGANPTVAPPAAAAAPPPPPPTSCNREGNPTPEQLQPAQEDDSNKHEFVLPPASASESSSDEESDSG